MKRTPDPNRPPNNPLYPNLKVKERMYKTAEEMQAKINEYFESLKAHTEEVMSASGAIKEIKRPLTPTVESLASHLGMKMQTLLVYESAEGYEEFHDTVAFAKAKILGAKTLALVNGKGSATGLIFDLVNNHGYKNKSEVESKNENDTTIRVVYE
jgi:hypothetical protein